MKRIENITKFYCTTCSERLFKKYAYVYRQYVTDALMENTERVDRSQYDHTMVLVRVEPPEQCHINEDGTKRWKFILKTREEAYENDR